MTPNREKAEAKHSPLPWSVTPILSDLHSLKDAEGEQIQCMNAADAELVKVCVNSHSALVEALEHMKMCRDCAEGAWEDCEGGLFAIAALKAAKEAA
jgi:hypothetical protein